jgi:hypothetical protein
LSVGMMARRFFQGHSVQPQAAVNTNNDWVLKYLLLRC